MKTVRTALAWKKAEKNFGGKTLGFVPTMGALHDGHLSLIRRAKKENDLVCASVFVNPTQFNDPKDYAKYPSTLKRDSAMLKKEGVDFLFSPSYRELYPDAYSYRVSEKNFSGELCGRFRPGHFDGVLTVVLKLINIISPSRAYFGEKDYQQYLLVKKMAEAFFLKTEIIPCPTVREKDGLAMSSRNLRLGPAERTLAPELYRALVLRKSDISVKKILKKKGFRVEYVTTKSGRRFAAAKLGEVRLIDNVKI